MRPVGENGIQKKVWRIKMLLIHNDGKTVVFKLKNETSTVPNTSQCLFVVERLVD